MELIKKHFSALIAVISSVSVLGGGFYAYGVFENRIAQTKTDIAVLDTEMELLKLQMEELNIKNSNPLQ